MKNYKGYAAFMGGRIVQIFMNDPRKDLRGKSIISISKEIAKLAGETFTIKPFTFRV